MCAVLYICQFPSCACAAPQWATKRTHSSMGNEFLLALAVCWSKLQWQKTISGAAVLQSPTDLEDGGSTTLPLPAVYPFPDNPV